MSETAPPAAASRGGDLLAGLLLAGLLVPQAIAYAGIAGVDPQRGLYAAAVGLLTYALLGTGRHTVVSPTSSAAAIAASAVAPLAAGDPLRYAAFAAALTIAVGLFFLAASLLRLGAISDFVSKPVLKGFMFGLGLTVAAKQLGSLSGVAGVHGNFFEALLSLLRGAAGFDATTLGIGLVSLAAMFAAGRWLPRLPAGLLVLAAGIAASVVLHLSDHGVAVVGPIATGLPLPALPGVGWRQGITLFEAAAGITLVAFSEALGTGRTFGLRHGYEISPNRELLALGAANFAAGIFQGIPVGVGASGSAVNERSGAKSQRSSVVAAIVVVLTLLFLMPLFAPLPQAVLAAVVIHAVSGLMDLGELRRYTRIRRGLVPSLTALVGVLALGVLDGILLAMAVNLVMLLERLASPGVVELGRLPGSDTYVDLDLHPDAERVPGLLLLRIDGIVFYGSVQELLSRVRRCIREAEPGLHSVLLGCEVLFDLDVAGLDMLAQLQHECRAQGVELVLCRAGDSLREILERAGLQKEFGPDRVYYSRREAVLACSGRRSFAEENAP